MTIVEYLVWYDDTQKKTAVEKIRDAISAYMARFAIAPTLVLVNIADHAEVAGVLVRSERTVQPNTFWVGMVKDEG